MFTFLLFVLGLTLLVIGADVLVRGAASLATRLGVSPLIIGLTVVAFGTSAPELAVSVDAALSGNAAVGLGNLIGSNIFNVLFILGLAAAILPLTVAVQLIRLDVPIMIGASVLVWWMARDLQISGLEGGILLALLIAYSGFLFVKGRAETAAAVADFPTAKQHSLWLDLVFIGTGLTMLVFGSQWLLDSVLVFARAMGVSELVIGLTLVAAGTSLPEVVTSIAASIKGQRDIAVGNVVGSNIFNLLGVLGVTSMLAPAGLAVPVAALHVDLPLMCLVALLCLPVFFTDGIISRAEGVLLFVAYIAYTLYLVLAAMHHPWLTTYSQWSLALMLPFGLAIVGQLTEQWRRDSGV